MKIVDVDINITAHKEGYYLYRTLKSVTAIREKAAENDIFTAVKINLDNADELTTEFAYQYARKHANVEVFNNKFGDLSASRNFLAAKSTAEYTLFVDGDDLFTENFIVEAYQVAKAFKKPCVVSAENIVKFSNEIDHIIFRCESTVENPDIKTALFEMNLFVSQNFVSTEIYKHVLYEPNEGNYGFEDWHWNTKTVAAGFEFLIAPSTFFFYRQKPDDQSLLRQSVNSNTVIRKTALFAPQKFKSLYHESYDPENQEALIYVSTRPFADKIEQTLRKIFTRESLEYRGSRKIYRTFNRLTGKTHTHNPVTEKSDEDFRGLKKYTFTEHDKDLWRRLNKIEPLIRIDENLENGVHIYRNKREHSLATAYHNFCKHYANSKFTDVIFVPWLKMGGADLAMIDLAKTLAAAGRSVLVVTTTGLDSEWADKLRGAPNVTFIQSHDAIFRNLDHVNVKMFFLKLVQNWSIKTMTIMNSSIGFELVQRYGSAIRDTGCRVIVHNYAFPTSNSLIIDAFPSLTMSFHNIDKFVVDSKLHKTEFENLYGIQSSKIAELPLTIDEEIVQKNSTKVTKKILYANRIAREKSPDVAIETAKLLGDQGVSMDMYGAIDADYAKQINFIERVNILDNVEYKGLFNNSKSFNFSQYDICFMPSLYEGTPRIVLESIKAGLYIVCTDAGGMPEVIQSTESGKVLPIGSSPASFANAIIDYYNNTSLHDIEKRNAANSETIQRHSSEQYVAQVNSIYQIGEE